MRADDIRFLFAFDRWATGKVLETSQRVMEDDWTEGNRIDRRGLGGILIHALGAHERWRSGWEGMERLPRREDGPMITRDELAAAWTAEWAAMDRYLGTLADADMDSDFNNVTLWHSLVHLVNHGTQHRSEAAVLLTAYGHSPGDLDLIFFAPARRGS